MANTNLKNIIIGIFICSRSRNQEISFLFIKMTTGSSVGTAQNEII